MVTVDRKNEDSPGRFIESTSQAFYSGDNNIFYDPNPNNSSVEFMIDGSQINFEAWQAFTNEDGSSYVVEAVLQGDAPANNSAPNGAWWVV